LRTLKKVIFVPGAQQKYYLCITRRKIFVRNLCITCRKIFVRKRF
jgi:hypothetical protein